MSNSMKVECNGGKLWFVLGFLFFTMCAIGIKLGNGQASVVGLLILALLGVLAVLWGLLGATHCIELGDHFIIHYLLRKRVIPWSDISHATSQRHEGGVKTGIPLVKVPVESNVLTVHLKSGKEIEISDDPGTVRDVVNYINRQVATSPERIADAAEKAAAKERRSDLLQYGIGGAAVFVGCLIFAFYSGHEVLEGRNSLSWPETTGEMISASVSAKTTTDRKRGDQTTYTVEVQYKYFVDGAEHNGRRYRTSPTQSQDSEQMMTIIRQWQPGDQIKVRYNPGKPSVSVLEPGVDAVRCLWLITASVVGICGLAVGTGSLYLYSKSQ